MSLVARNLGTTAILALATLAVLMVTATVLATWRQLNEIRAAHALLAIFDAQTRFQSGSYLDLDSDGVGAYGHLSQLTGQHRTTSVSPGVVRLLDRVFHCQGPEALALPRATAMVTDVVGGYRFASFICSGSDIPAEVPSGLKPRAERGQLLANDSERCFLIVAWPEHYGFSGHLSFAITTSGRLLAADLEAVASADTVAAAFFGSAKQALLDHPSRPEVVMPEEAVARFTSLAWMLGSP